MHTDHALLTGTQHSSTGLPCQDYCLSGVTEHGAWAVVSDGCSTGGNTDLGARAWTLSARQVLARAASDQLGPLALRDLLLSEASPALRGLDFDDGPATLAALTAAAGRVNATFFGDGALLMRHFDGSMTAVNLQFTQNAPGYLNYLREPGLWQLWLDSYPGQELLAVTNRYDPEGNLLGMKTESVPADQGWWHWTGDIPRDELDLVVLATDGIATRQEGLAATVKQILGVKGTTGEFMRRRVGRLARDWLKSQDMPRDDLAVAAVWLAWPGE